MNSGNAQSGLNSDPLSNPMDSLVLPLYADELHTYPVSSPIFIAVDRLSLQRIRSFKGVCLFCPNPAKHYALNFCYQREIWVLYAHLSLFSRAMDLAHCTQWQGAAKTLVLRIGLHNLQG